MSKMKKDLEILRDIRKKTSKNSGNGTQEFFTPLNLVDMILDKIPEEDWNPMNDKTFLDSTCGNGNFLIKILERKLYQCDTIEEALRSLKSVYGTELMQDNVGECKERMIDMMKMFCDNHGILFGKYAKDIIEIVDHNIVCTDTFDWDYENWKKLNNV